MKLPNAARAIIDPEKLYGYLLSEAHPVGRFKFAFFRSLGYASDRWKELEAGIRSHAETGQSQAVDVSEYGQKYVVRGLFSGPSGREARLVSVWIVLHGEEVPRFITAFPGE